MPNPARAMRSFPGTGTTALVTRDGDSLSLFSSFDGTVSPPRDLFKKKKSALRPYQIDKTPAMATWPRVGNVGMGSCDSDSIIRDRHARQPIRVATTMSRRSDPRSLKMSPDGLFCCWSMW